MNGKNIKFGLGQNRIYFQTHLVYGRHNICRENKIKQDSIPIFSTTEFSRPNNRKPLSVLFILKMTMIISAAIRPSNDSMFKKE